MCFLFPACFRRKVCRHLFHQPFGNRQAEAGPLVDAMSPGSAVLDERLEYLADFFREDSDSGVGDAENQRPLSGFFRKTERGGNRDPPLWVNFKALP